MNNMKLIPNRYYSYGTMRKYSRILYKARSLGYEESINYCKGYIDCLFKEKKIDAYEKRMLLNIHVKHVPDKEGLGSRYIVDNRGRIEDYDK